MSLAIVGSSGGLKGIFVQGVFKAFEEAKLRADAYAGASASTLPAISAATQLCEFVGLHYWEHVLDLLKIPGNDLSHVMRTVTREWEAPDQPFKPTLFRPNTPRLFIPANYVKTPEAAALTQTEDSRKLGRKLLLQIGKKDRSWVDAHLESHLFDTHAPDGKPRLSPDNLADVAYASTRMIHWSVPAWIDGKPYVDASYTSACPVEVLFSYGYTKVIAISTELPPLYHDIFADHLIDESNPDLFVIRPRVDLAELGVTFTECSDDGLVLAYEHGHEQGHRFLETWQS